MKVGVILATSQIDKNKLVYDAVKKYADGCEVINFGCFSDDGDYSYVEISIVVGLLLASGSVDFVVTGCSSGQGMMLACNNLPGVICGYVPTPMDAYLFAQINNGNAVSLPLGEKYTYSGSSNCIQTLEKLFSEPFGQGYPKSEAERKLKDTRILKQIREKSQIEFVELLKRLELMDSSLIEKILKKNDVVEYILKNGNDEKILKWIDSYR